MNSFKVLVIFLVFRNSNSLVSELLSGKTSTPLIDQIRNLSLGKVLNLFSITDDGAIDLNGLMKKLNSSVDIPSILNSLGVPVPHNGLLDLKTIVSNLDATKHVNMTDDLNLFNVKNSNGVNDLKSFIRKLKSVNLTQILNTSLVNNSEDGRLDFVGLAQKYIGTVMEYNVTTEDGYILKLYRIPGKGPSVLLSHGLLDTSDGFIARGNTSLAYILTKKGYDVWVLNYRGNRYSRSHKTFNSDTDKAYWQFSMQEKGYYDLSAIIDFILKTTGRGKVNVIGHSEGTATVLLLMATRSKYTRYINLFIALSPVCYLSDSGLLVTAAVRLGPIINALLLATGIEETFGYYSVSTKLFQLLCSQGTVGYDLCLKVGLSAVLGYDPDNLEQTFWHTFLGHYPGGASRKEYNHYFQIGNKDVFGQYDYGAKKNMEVYGTATAPIYDLNKVKMNVSLVVAKNDKIFGLAAGNRLRRELPNVVDYYVVKDEQFNHIDFMVGRNAYKYLYPHINELLTKYN